MARAAGAETLDYRSDRLLDQIKDKTEGQEPDSVIEAVGLESHGTGGVMEALQTKLTEQERPFAFDAAIDPSFLITQRVGLEQGPELCKTFRDREDGCINVFIRP